LDSEVRRCFIAALAATPLAAAASRAFAAEGSFPEHPIRIVVPFPPGGGVDQVARLIGRGVATELGQPVVVENRSGAGGNIGASAVARAKPDGYSLLILPTGVLALAPLMFADPGYSPSKDLTPVAVLTTLPQILMVGAGSQFRDLQALLDYARANPRKLTVASSGRGTGQHLAVELFMKLANVEFLQVPYKGSADVMRSVLGGETDMMFVDPAALPQVRAGTLRALAVTTEGRIAALPDTPAIAEHAKGYEAASYYVLMAPAGTPADVLARLNAAVNKTQRDPQLRDRFENDGMLPMVESLEFAGRFVNEQTEKWTRFIADAGIALK
jgi:tripartite-type tricarboxylate transporter receptor subunit TctC